MWIRKHSLLLLVVVAPCLFADNSEKALGNALKARYKGVPLTVMVANFAAGEFKKSMKVREDGVNWWHYHEGVSIRRETAVLDQIDDRTFSTGPISWGAQSPGANVFPVGKGERLMVSNVIFGCSRGVCTLILFLDTMKLSKMAALDPRKENGNTVPLFESAGLGCAFFFIFARDTIEQSGAEDLISSTVGKYLQPTEKAEKALKAEKNIEIDIGATEEEVIEKLGEPLKTIRFGPQKTLKYPDMTVTLKDGKVSDVKVE